MSKHIPNPGRRRKRTKRALAAKRNAQLRSTKRYIRNNILDAVLEEVFSLSETTENDTDMDYLTNITANQENDMIFNFVNIKEEPLSATEDSTNFAAFNDENPSDISQIQAEEYKVSVNEVKLLLNCVKQENAEENEDKLCNYVKEKRTENFKNEINGNNEDTETVKEERWRDIKEEIQVEEIEFVNVEAEMSNKPLSNTHNFFNNHLLTDTSNIEEEEKEESCPVCLKTFPYKQALQGHMLLHTTTKIFHCEICLKRFRDMNEENGRFEDVGEEIRNQIVKEGNGSVEIVVGKDIRDSNWYGGSREDEEICEESGEGSKKAMEEFEEIELEGKDAGNNHGGKRKFRKFGETKVEQHKKRNRSEENGRFEDVKREVRKRIVIKINGSKEIVVVKDIGDDSFCGGEKAENRRKLDEEIYEDSSDDTVKAMKEVEEIESESEDAEINQDGERKIPEIEDITLKVKEDTRRKFRKTEEIEEEERANADNTINVNNQTSGDLCAKERDMNIKQIFDDWSEDDGKQKEMKKQRRYGYKKFSLKKHMANKDFDTYPQMQLALPKSAKTESFPIAQPAEIDDETELEKEERMEITVEGSDYVVMRENDSDNDDEEEENDDSNDNDGVENDNSDSENDSGDHNDNNCEHKNGEIGKTHQHLQKQLRITNLPKRHDKNHHKTFYTPTRNPQNFLKPQITSSTPQKSSEKTYSSPVLHKKTSRAASKHYECSICLRTFNTKAGLVVHQQEHAGEHRCPICRRTFALQWLEAHVRAHIDFQKIGFRTNYEGRRPKSTHNDGRVYSCEACAAQFTSRAELKRHLAVHRAEIRKGASSLFA